jgi:hypothetical protein
MTQQLKKTLVISIYFALAVSTFLVFWQVRNFDFVNYDDDLYVSENQHVLNGLTTDAVRWALTARQAANWHPLTWLSLMLDSQLFGPNPAALHLTNLFFHIANTLLLFLVLRRMTGAIWQSAFVAALFALHPLHVESVAWVSERKDVLSTFFWLLTMWAYMRYTQKMNTAPLLSRLCNKYYLLTAAFFVLGLMSKPMVVTLPFVLLLLDYWPLNRAKNYYRLILEKIPFFILSAFSSVITFLIQRKAGAVVNINILPLKDRIANVFVSYVQYISKIFWPQNLAVLYPHHLGPYPFWQVAACALLLFVISIFVIRAARNYKYLLFGWFWFIVTLIPVIGFVQVSSQAWADRYTYIPYIGLFIMPAWLLPQLLSKVPYRKIVLGVSMAIVLTAIGLCARHQAGYWKNSITLFSHAVKVTQNNWLAYNNLAVAFSGQNRWLEAIDACKQAITIKPDYAAAYLNLGFAYGSLGRWPEAKDAYHQALKINPNYDKAHYSLALIYFFTGNKSSALAEYNILKSLNPEMANDLLNQINKP